MQEENFSIPKMNACLHASAPDSPLCFIRALKVCEGVLNIAYNIYTSRLLPKDCCLNGPLGGPEVGREGTTVSRQPPACVPITHWRTDREAWQAISVWQMPYTNASHQLDVNGRSWNGGLALTARLEQSQKGKYRSHGGGEKINITFICLTRVTTAWQAASE